MAIGLNVRADIRSAQLFLRELGPGRGTHRATSRALNKTATAVRAEGAKRIQEQRALRIGVIKQAMKITRATVQRLTAIVSVSGKPISIRHFANVGTRGVTVRIRKGGKRTLLRRYGNKAFTNPAIGAGLSIFVRQTKKRLPLAKWPPVPGLPSVFVQERIVAALHRVARDVFHRRFREEMNFEINKARIKTRRGA